MKKSRINTLFDRYLEGKCTYEEKRELVDLLSNSNDPEATTLLEKLWHEEKHQLPAGRSSYILEQITPDAETPQRNFPWLKVAAAISLLMLAAAVTYQFLPPKERLQTTETAQAEVSAQQRYVELPDGSTVILNKGSKLDFQPFDGKEAREVFLSGEGFFDIRHDDSKPFIVRTDKISTTVLGTAFNIKAYPGEDNITITVTRGKVRVSDESQVLGILTRDEQITYHRNSEVVNQARVESHEAVVWMEKDIYFDDVTMLAAVQELENRFGVLIELENADLNECRFTATFVRGEDLYQILDVICEFNQAEYVTDDAGRIRISGTGCKKQ